MQTSFVALWELSFERGEEEVRVIALQDIPAFEAVGEIIGPIERGRELKMRYWIARVLAQQGFIRIRDDISLQKLHEFHRKELVQPGKRLFPLPRGFFAALKRYLDGLKEGEERARAQRLATDIVNCRLRKIVALATLRKPTRMLIQAMAEEEARLYRALKNVINCFKSATLGKQLERKS